MKSPLIVASLSCCLSWPALRIRKAHRKRLNPRPRKTPLHKHPTRLPGWKHTAVRPTHGYKLVQKMPDRAGWTHNATFFSAGANQGPRAREPCNPLMMKR